MNGTTTFSPSPATSVMVSSSPTNAARSPMKYTAATGASMVTGRTRSTAEATERAAEDQVRSS